MQSGDLIIILMGSTRPVLLRPSGVDRDQNKMYRIVGDCYSKA